MAQPSDPVSHAMMPAAFSDAIELMTSLAGLCSGEHTCTAIIDVSRYENAEHCASALGIDDVAFAALPNLYGNFSPDLKAQGPRLYSPPLLEAGWESICRETLARQAASFIVHDGDADDLQRHLRTLIKLQQPDGSKLLFRFQDTAVLSTLAPLLTPSQRRVLLGPSSDWLVLDVCGKPEHIFGDSSGGLQPSTLTLSAQQTQLLDAGLWPAKIIEQANDVDRTLLAEMSKCRQWQTVRQAARRAQDHGLHVLEDVALFSVLSLQLPAHFDREGPVARALERSKHEGIGFGEAIDQVPAEEWRAWQEVLDSDGVD